MLNQKQGTLKLKENAKVLDRENTIPPPPPVTLLNFISSYCHNISYYRNILPRAHYCFITNLISQQHIDFPRNTLPSGEESDVWYLLCTQSCGWHLIEVA